METKIQIKSRFGTVLFEYEKNENTIKDTVEEAISTGVNLSDAYLRGADLSDADLRGAYLRGADLSCANLSDADLSGADLSCTNLRNADLSYTKMDGTNFNGAICVPMHCKWHFGITNDKIQIGCKKGTITEWDAFFASDETHSTPRETPDFTQIQAVYEGLKAYYQFLNK